MRMRLGTALTLAIVLASACGTSPTSPTAVELLPRPYMYLCHRWDPGVPPVRRTVFDLTFGGNEADAVSQVGAAGGRVRYSFQSRLILRADLDVAAIAKLETPPGELWMATTVTNPDNYEVSLIVGYDRPMTPADIAVVEAVGGRFLYQSVRGQFMVVLIDDHLVNAVRALPGVKSAVGNTWGCID